MQFQNNRSITVAALLVIVSHFCASRAWAVDYPETEANDTKPAANAPPALNTGDSVSGATTGTSTTTPGITSADYFRISTAPAALGIYRHRMQLTTTGTLNQTGTIRGLTQTGGVINPGTDAIAQTASTTASGTLPPRTVQWYGFGKQEEVFYRVTGVAASTDYTATLTTTSVTPVVATIPFAPGSITISRPVSNTTDLDFWVYDSNLDAIPDFGRDSPAPEVLTRNYTAGTYYIAITNFNFANNQPASSDDTWLTGTAVDFPNVVVNSSTTATSNLSITITGAGGVNETLTLAKTEAFEVIFVQFTVNSGDGSCCLDTAECVETTAAGCATVSGNFSAGQTCATTTCVGSGACCADAVCSIQTEAACLALPGSYQGNGTDCDPNPCIGACCIASLAECQDLTETACLAASGVYQGDGTACAGTNCGFCPCPTPISTFPHYENFEASATCGTTCNPACVLTSDWTNLGAPDDDAQWAVDENGTPSSPTGPSNPATNTGTTGGLDFDPGTTTGNYAYIESSSCLNRTAILLSPCFDFTGLTTPQFTFAYHMFGADMDTASLHVEVSTNNCVSWTSVFTTTGDQGNVWHTPSISLAAYQSFSNVRIRIRGVTGADFLSDLAIDALLVRETPTSGACCKADGTCTDEPSEAACTGISGTFQGLGTNCATANCGGACCTLGLCTDVTSQNACTGGGGTFQGFGTACTTTECPLANDTCATATTIAALPFSATPDFTTATHDQDIACNAATNTETRFGVWYTYTPTTSCVARFRETSTNDIALAVFSGADCNSLTEVFCSAAESSNFAMTANTQYWILIGHASATTVPTIPLAFFLDECITPIEADFCSTAKVISAVPYTDTIDHIPASDDADVSCNSTTTQVQLRHGVWYTYTPATSCTAVIGDTSTNDVAITVYSGADCNNLTEVQCSDPEPFSIALNGGTQYWILVGMWSGVTIPTVPLTVTVDCSSPPANDTCATPTAITSLPFNDTPSNTLASDDVDVQCNAPAATVTRFGLWYSYSPTANCVLNVSESSTQNVVIALFADDCTTQLECDDSGTTDNASFNLMGGTSYRILVGQQGTATTLPTVPLNLTFDCVAPTGRCCVGQTCSVVTQSDCVANSGLYGGDFLNCEGDLVFSDDVTYAIPDNVEAGVSAPLAVPAVNVTDVVVEIDFVIEHAWLGDMIATLTYDDGVGGVTSAHIFARVGRGDALTLGSPFGNGADMTGLYRFGDEFAGNLWTTAEVGGDMPQGDYRASTNNNSGATTFPGNGPFVDLNTVFGGPRPAGTWTLKIADVGAALTGSFKWRLVLNNGGATPCDAPACDCDGDVNDDNALNGLDVPAFTAAVIAGAGQCADVNGDTTVDAGDVDDFVNLLLTGQTCP